MTIIKRFLLLALLLVFGIPYLLVLIVTMPLGKDHDYASWWLWPMDWWLDHWRDDSDSGLLQEWVRLHTSQIDETYSDWLIKTQILKIENKLKGRGLKIAEHIRGFYLEKCT